MLLEMAYVGTIIELFVLVRSCFVVIVACCAAACVRALRATRADGIGIYQRSVKLYLIFLDYLCE